MQFRTALVASGVLGAGTALIGAATVDAADAPAPAASSADTSDLSEIIVTAQRVEERLQDVPISITVFNQQQIEDLNIKSTNDLALFTPSLTSNARYGQNSATYSIRGFYQELRTTASVATYFADVVAPRAPGSISSAGDGGGPAFYFDLQNAEVLKGPQGTLFGRNTTGGAVLLVPQKPTDEVGGYAEVSAGDYNLHRYQAMFNAPINDSLRFRVAVDWNKRDGYIRNLSGVGPSDFDNVNYVAARASLVWDITQNVENYTIASLANSLTDGVLTGIDQCYPAGAFGSFACAETAREAPRNLLTGYNDIPNPYQKSQYWSVINTTRWRPSDNLTVKNIASYAQVTGDDDFNPYGNNFIYPAAFSFPLPGGGAFNLPYNPAVVGKPFSYAEIASIPGGHTANQATYTEELQLQGNNLDGRLTWQSGAYFEKSLPISRVGTFGPEGGVVCTNLAAFQCVDGNGPIFTALEGSPNFIPSQYQLVRNEYTNLGIYSQATYKFTNQWSLTGGLRYTWDETVSNVNKYDVYYEAPNTPSVDCETPGLPGSSPAPGVYPLTVQDIGTACAEHLSEKSHAPTGTVALDYTPVEDVLLYAKYSRGYRQGSTSPLSISGGAASAITTYKPEHVDVFEVGDKIAWKGAVPGVFDLSVFYNKFTDQQVLVEETVPDFLPNIAIINAGKSRIYGAELEAEIQPFTGLHLDANYAYLNSELQSLVLPSVPSSLALEAISAPGNPLPQTPKNKFTIAARYDLPLPQDIGRVDVGANYAYTGSYYFSLRVPSVDLNPSYGLLGVNVNWHSVFGGPIDLSFFGTNMLNKLYQFRLDDNVTEGFVGSAYGEPRMWGLRMRYSFGGK